MIKIYFNNKAVYLLSEAEAGDFKSSYPDHTSTRFYDDPNLVWVMVDEMKREEIKEGILVCPSVEDCLDMFRQVLLPVPAGGGFVFTPSGEVLMIFRRGKWDLPKGKLDDGEDLETCAVREVMEETGIKKIELIEKLCVTYHTYHNKGRHVLKESHWYLMKGDNEVLEPQTEEDIEECRWVKIQDIDPYLGESHGSIADVLRIGKEKLAQISARPL